MTYLVTGATGNVGRHVVDQLLKANQKVRALTRNPETANLPTGTETVAGDLANPGALAPAFDGVAGVHLITFNGDAYTPLTTAGEIIELAKKNGVKRMTVLSGSLEEGEAERMVKASGLEWTILQPVEFMSNILADWKESIRSEGLVRDPFPYALSARVHEADIAAVAVSALLESGHAGKSYELTGPEAISRIEAVRLISEQIGREIKFEEQTIEQARAQWRQWGFSEEDMDFFIQMGANTPKVGYTVQHTVEQVTGRPARTLTQWIREHAHHFNE